LFAKILVMNVLATGALAVAANSALVRGNTLPLVAVTGICHYPKTIPLALCKKEFRARGVACI